jgi:hypothetical protein
MKNRTTKVGPSTSRLNEKYQKEARDMLNIKQNLSSAKKAQNENSYLGNISLLKSPDFESKAEETYKDTQQQYKKQGFFDNALPIKEFN